MRGVRRGLTLVTLMVTLGVCGRMAAQVATTTIQDTVYRADGTAAGGTVVVSWPAFTTAAGQAVAAGNTSATLGANGALSVALSPNAGAAPTGTYYTAVFHLNDGSTNQEYWVVPVSATPVTLATIENEVLPASVAMQTASRAYVDAKVAQVTSSPALTTTTTYVPTTGGTMTGPLVLPGDPVTPTQAADKHYVDTNVTSLAAGVGQKVSMVPTVGQTVAQPAGTQLAVNALNGDFYASQFQAGDGGAGITNALATCTGGTGCRVVADPSYNNTEPVSSTEVPEQGRVVDQRGGADTETFVDPVNTAPGSVGETLNQTTTLSDANSSVAGSGVGTTRLTLSLSNTVVAGGSNQNPANVESAPYQKANYGVALQTGNYFAAGQHVQDGHVINCYAVGDCLEGSYYLTTSGGYRDLADEGAHPFDLQVSEDWHAFQGTCTGGCSTGSTSVMVTATEGGGTQGEGRYLIDKNPAKTITAGQLVSSGGGVFTSANFTGTNFPVSVFLQVTAAATSQPKNIAPGTVTLPIATSNVPAGFGVNTSQLPATSGVACVADTNDSRFPNFEMANYTVVDASHITLTLNKVHGVNAVLAVGGLCGYGLEQTVDTTGYVRQVFPVVGSINATSLYYAAALTPLVGFDGNASTSGFLNVSGQITSLSRNNNTVTATLSSNLPVDVNGLTMTVSGAADPSYNGSFQVATTGGNTLTYPDTGANSTSSGGSISYVTGGFVLYPMAEVLSVYDATSKQVDGLLQLGANTVTWAPGDAVEEPHYYQALTAADTEFVTQYMPRPIQFSSAGKQYAGQVGPGMRGWVVQNAVPASNYLGGGGTHQLPDDAYEASGPWTTDFEVDAGTNAVIKAHCNINGCNRWDSGYSLFQLQTPTGWDALYYAPQSSTAVWSLGGQAYTFAPTSLSIPGAVTVGASSQFSVNGTGNVTGATLNLTGGATGSNYDLNIVDSGQNQLYVGTTDNSGYAVFRFGTPTQIWQFADGGHTSAVPDTWYVYDQTHATTAFSIQGGTESATFAGTVTAPQYMGPATAPAGSCSTNGAWVFSQDGHATFCSAGTWVTKI